MKRFLLLFCALCATTLTWAAIWTSENGITLTYSVSSNKATITDCNSNASGELVIPSTLGDYPVTTIGNNAFYGCSCLTSVKIPSSVTSIGSSAFWNCSGLTSVVIPSCVTTIYGDAFNNCSGLKEVHISSIVAWCTIKFSGSSSNPLAYAKNLYLNGELVTNLIIPEGVTLIGNYAFYGCSGLTSVVIPEGVTSIGNYAFDGCSGLTSVVIPSSVTSIGEDAFSGCSGLTSVVIPEGVTSIGNYAFDGCSGLTSVVIPEGVTSIGYRAFYNCRGLTSVVIPSSVTSIGSYAFNGCSNLLDVYMAGPPPEGIEDTYILGKYISYSKSSAGAWQQLLKTKGYEHRDAGYFDPAGQKVTIVSSGIREDDPTVLDVVYKVESRYPTVKVRALAFRDGERSFAKVVRPVTFIEGTATNIGDAIETGVEHTLSWKVSSDWQETLAKVSVEVLAVEEEILPLQLTMLPATEAQPQMEVSWNAQRDTAVFDALLWCYADGDTGLTLTDGVLKNGTTTLANGRSLTKRNATVYLYNKMGYALLEGDRLSYARARLRRNYPATSTAQYAVKVFDDVTTEE